MFRHCKKNFPGAAPYSDLRQGADLFGAGGRFNKRSRNPKTWPRLPLSHADVLAGAAVHLEGERFGDLQDVGVELFANDLGIAALAAHLETRLLIRAEASTILALVLPSTPVSAMPLAQSVAAASPSKPAMALAAVALGERTTSWTGTKVRPVGTVKRRA